MMSKILNNKYLFALIILEFFSLSLWGQDGYYLEPYIEIEMKELFIKPNQRDTIAFIAEGNDLRGPVLWRSLMPAVANVDAYGVVTGKRAGRTYVIAYTSDNKASDTCMVTVTNSRSFTVNGVGFDMIYVKGGVFWMGAQSDDENAQNYDFYARGEDILPVHSVTLSDYYIGETEVTQALWEAVMHTKPTVCGERWNESQGLGSNYPAYFVSWDDCQMFIDRLNMLLEKQLKGYVFAFPTEAQWEFAARGGIYATMKNGQYCHAYAGSEEIEEVAFYGASFDKGSTQVVKMKKCNELGVYDMSGNVAEWCADRLYSVYKSYKSDPDVDPYYNDGLESNIIRGGSCVDDQFSCTVYSRSSFSSLERQIRSGLRLVLYKKNQQWVKKIGKKNIKPPLRIII